MSISRSTCEKLLISRGLIEFKMVPENYAIYLWHSFETLTLTLVPMTKQTNLMRN